MFGGEAKTLSTRDDHTNAAIISPYYLGSHDAQDLQTIPASSALCSLNQYHQHDSLKSETNNIRGLSSFQDARMSPQLAVYEHATSDEKHAYPTPTMPNHGAFSGHVVHEHLAPQNSALVDLSHRYGERAMPSMLTAYDLPVFAPFQQPNPPSETSSLPFSAPSTPATSMYASSRSFNSTPCSTVESDHVEMDPRMYLMEHAKSARSINLSYAKLIERALLEAEGNKMFLKDIYTWIEMNTNKASDPSSNGWKNSVRHNLSMNGAFTKVEAPSPENKSHKVYMWMLEPSARLYGIQSTTQFRHKAGTRRSPRNVSGRSSLVNEGRVQSGRKGGRASRPSTQLRRNPKSVATWRSWQDLEHDSSSTSGHRGFDAPPAARPESGPVSFFHPHLNAPQAQHFSAPISEDYNYNGHPDYVGQESTLPFGAYQNLRLAPMDPLPIPAKVHYPTSGY